MGQQNPVSIYKMVAMDTVELQQLMKNDYKKSMTEFMMRKKIYIADLIDREIETIEPPKISYLVNAEMSTKEIFDTAITQTQSYEQIIEASLARRASEDDGMSVFLFARKLTAKLFYVVD